MSMEKPSLASSFDDDLQEIAETLARGFRRLHQTVSAEDKIKNNTPSTSGLEESCSLDCSAPRSDESENG